MDKVRCPASNNGIPCNHRLFDADVPSGVSTFHVKCPKCKKQSTVRIVKDNPKQ